MPVPPADLYDQYAADFDADTGLDALPETFRDLLDSFVESLDGPAVLDAGCGPGRDVEYFLTRGLDPVGIDLARGMVEYARENRPGRYLQMDVRRLGFESDRFDGLWCPASLFFVPPEEMETALSEFVRVLRPGGVARVGFKLGDGPVEVEKWDATTVEYHVSESEARGLLEAAGFRVESVSVDEVSPERTFANFRCREAGRS
ncbi:class I SAM-dependent methyltransferase [Halorussus sp. MSC15.2]|uniref:class I SAM-dependent DNA methyltransferase n=1 Tax=Halorussus sp. MSC15.2 TaxID=2283638 RepID=UPI0013D5A3A6|nr:class I SAM-dependent methyltransferase [Halorussus sp. MSC15.2]NEU58919.1 class I SAM-dependent methyltransferase [Halorussus sp. MSC15.2]